MRFHDARLSGFDQPNSNLVNAIGIAMVLSLSLYVTLALGNTGFMRIGAYVAAVLTIRSHAPFLISGAMDILASMVVGNLLVDHGVKFRTKAGGRRPGNG